MQILTKLHERRFAASIVVLLGISLVEKIPQDLLLICLIYFKMSMPSVNILGL